MEVRDIYMRRALQLARNGELDVSPNPMVGAVIVDFSGAIIGEGWHRRCGEGHAEVNAIASVADKSKLRDATMYVTLEPCSHYGKTPPCADLIVSMGISCVVVGSLDPFEKVSGRGVSRLCEAGIEVVTGVLEAECRELNKKFMTAHRLHRPYVTLKWAQSADGFIDGKVSTPLTSAMVHKLRATNDAILIGSGTALADDPLLDTRLYAGKSPIKIVLDRRCRINRNMKLFRDNRASVMVLSDYGSLNDMLGALYQRGITSVLVEGGAKVLQSFIDAGIWDEIRTEIGAKNFNSNVKAPNINGLMDVIGNNIVDGNQIITLRNNENNKSEER